MNIQTSLFITLLLSLFSGCDNSSTANNVSNEPSQEIISIRVADTDAAIFYQPDSHHLALDCLNAPCQERLFVFFPGSGSPPDDYQKILRTMSSAGMKGVVLAYENGNSITDMCGEEDACYKESRQDRLFGSPSSTYVSSVADGIDNRLLKMLQHLKWDAFYDADVLLYNKIVFSGFSQGAGMAALIGKQKIVDRVCMFSGPWDHTSGPFPATWLSDPSQTPTTDFYGFTHMHDVMINGATFLDINWQQLGMGVDNIEVYRNLIGQRFYTDDEDSLCASDYHACSIRDDVTPLNNLGLPRYGSIWDYMCNGK